MERPPIALPAAPAAHGEKRFGNVDLDPPARTAPVMMLPTHNFLLLVYLRYILAASSTSVLVQFPALGLCFQAIADLFADPEIAARPPEAPAASAPLADRLRPTSLEEIVG